MYLTIFQSVERCHLLHFYYDGYFRVVEPHIYGVARNGRDIVYGYQIAGADALGRHVGWKTYYTGSMDNIHCLDAHFTAPRRGYSPSDRYWRRIYAQVARPQVLAAGDSGIHPI